MSNSIDSTPLPVLPSCVAKFYEMNDDLDAVQAVIRRAFFEFLRTQPTLTDDEVQMLWSVFDLLAELSIEQRRLAS